MKKHLLQALLLTVPIFGFSQIFQENFDGSGPGFEAWTLIDADQQTHASGVADFDAGAWIRKDRGGASPNYGGPDGDFAAMSSSWYDPAGTSNDWLISPQFTVSGNNPHLVWDAKAQDGIFRDGYKVMLSTNGGNTIADFDMELFSIPEERSIWKKRYVNLTPYLGKNVRIAFVNNSTDKFVLLVDNILVGDYTPPEAPACPAAHTPANGATDVAYVEGADLGWLPAPTGGTASFYNLYIGTDPNNLEFFDSTEATAINVTGLSPNTTYYWYVTAENDGGESSGCNLMSFTTETSVFLPYCGPVPVLGSVEPITLVDFAGIHNITDATLNTTPGHEDFISMTGNVTPGQSYNITLEGNTGGPEYTNRFAVFIDWNQDEIFSADESYAIDQTLTGSTGEDGMQITQQIAVPSNALAGTTRMRVKKMYGDFDYLDACAPVNFGQYEDYSLNVASLGLNNSNTKTNIKVYPNPVTDIMNIEGPAKVSSVIIFDASGKQVMTSSANASKSQVNMSRLAPGVYMVKAQTENGVQTFKVIKK